jgi:hypothetical protein
MESTPSHEDDATSERGADASLTVAGFLVDESGIVMSADLSQQTERETPQMSGADLTELEEVKRLIARGLRIGVLTYAEIATATAELDLADIDVAELHDVFERYEIVRVQGVSRFAGGVLL